MEDSGGNNGDGSGGGGWKGGSWLLGVGGATDGGSWQRPTSSGEGASSGGSNNGALEGANIVKLGGRRPAGKGGSSRDAARGKGCSQAGKGVVRGGCSQCSNGSLSAIQSHSLIEPRVVMAGRDHSTSSDLPSVSRGTMLSVWCLSTCHCSQSNRFEPSVNMAGGKATTRPHCWGEGNDPTVDCYLLVCTRVGDKVAARGQGRSGRTAEVAKMEDATAEVPMVEPAVANCRRQQQSQRNQ